MRTTGYTWNEYFKDKTDGDVYIQNLTDMAISLDIEIGPGQTQGKRVPASPHPVNLTEEYSFEVLKKSANFRRAHARRRNGRPDFVLLDESQVNAYLSAYAKQRGMIGPSGEPDIDLARDATDQERRRLTSVEVDGEHVSPSNSHNFAPPKSAQELIALDLAARGIFAHDGSIASQRMQAGGALSPNAIHVNEVVNPKVMHLCQQVSPQVSEPDRMPFEQFRAALMTMTNVLTRDDYAHIESHGTYRPIKKWAREQMAIMDSGTDGIDPEETMHGKSQVATAQRRGALMAVPQGFGPQGPASLGQQGTQYQGPSGFANAPFKEAFGAGESMASPILGPNGQPLE